jgi:hypothetical protein
VPQPGKSITVDFRFVVPEALLKRYGPISISAKAGDEALRPETYSIPGEHRYVRAVSPTAARAQVLRLDFALDRYASPGDFDSRELGLIALAIEAR